MKRDGSSQSQEDADREVEEFLEKYEVSFGKEVSSVKIVPVG